jgi:alpha-1,2-mannosyltransferase
VEPFRNLPGGGDLELTWTPGQNLLASVTLLLGVAFLVAAVGVALHRKPPTSVPPAQAEDQVGSQPGRTAADPVREVRL